MRPTKSSLAWVCVVVDICTRAENVHKTNNTYLGEAKTADAEEALGLQDRHTVL